MTKLEKHQFIKQHLLETYDYDISGLPIADIVSVPNGSLPEEEYVFLVNNVLLNHTPSGDGILNWGTSGYTKDNDYYWKAAREVYDEIFQALSLDAEYFKLPGMKEGQRSVRSVYNLHMLLAPDGRKVYFDEHGYGFICNHKPFELKKSKFGEIGTLYSTEETNLIPPTVFQIAEKGIYIHSNENHASISSYAKPKELRGNKSAKADFIVIALVTRFILPNKTHLEGQLISPEILSHMLAYPSTKLLHTQDIYNNRQDRLEQAKQSNDSEKLDGLNRSKLRPEVKISVDDMLRGNITKSNLSKEQKRKLYDDYFNQRISQDEFNALLRQ